MMIIKPMIRSNICLNCHPQGCARVVKRHIEYAEDQLADGKAAPLIPRLALIIGCSTGYGLASRIAAAFGYGTATIGISFEKQGTETKPGTPGFYNNQAFDREADRKGLVSVTINGDAYSDLTKAEAAAAIREAAIKAKIEPKADLIIYSLASPVRIDPKTGVMYKSVIKPIGNNFSGKTIDMMSGTISVATVEAASEEEIINTTRVMGGEDWELWIEALAKENVLSPNALTLAYTYIGPELSWAIYKNGTIGRAKEDLERACREINKKYGSPGTKQIRGAYISVNKALVTRASVVIPIIPFYVSCLFKIMKEKQIHEGCIEQIVRLYKERLYTAGAISANPETDSEGRIRMDDLEMREDVQKETGALMEKAEQETLDSLTDIAGFRHDFLEAHGFDVKGIDYDAEIDLGNLIFSGSLSEQPGK